jgi:hypothetical protein
MRTCRSSAVFGTVLLATAALGLAGCSAAPGTSFDPSAGEGTTATTPAPSSGIRRGTAWRDPNAIVDESAPAGAHLNYFGGHIVSNVQIVEVLYGSGTYQSFVSSTASPSMATFYGHVPNTGYVTGLSQYDTNISGGTNQKIGAGSFAEQVKISPSAANDGSTIDDTNIQAELTAQIAAGHLPAIAHDAAGNPDTLYMIHFPKGKTITQGGTASCQAGGFCAYHGTVGASSGPNGEEVLYGVLPDMSSGSGCDIGCGGGSAFGNQTSVASHEMAEAITDAEIGLATTFGPPLAWYDENFGEIGDICNAQQASFKGSDGVTYTVQKLFLNSANNCVVPGISFNLSVSPTTISISRGTSGKDTVKTSFSTGEAETVKFSVSGLVTGMTASFSPTSVTSGGSSTLTIKVGSSTATGTHVLKVKGSAASGSKTVSLTVDVP